MQSSFVLYTVAASGAGAPSSSRHRARRLEGGGGIKGRSGSRSLNAWVRRIHCLCFAGGLRLMLIYVPPEHNRRTIHPEVSPCRAGGFVLSQPLAARTAGSSRQTIPSTCPNVCAAEACHVLPPMVGAMHMASGSRRLIWTPSDSFACDDGDKSYAIVSWDGLR